MIDNVFYSILIRAALMGLQILSGGLTIVFLIRVNEWTELKMFRNKETFIFAAKALFCAVISSICFFCIRWMGGY